MYVQVSLGSDAVWCSRGLLFICLLLTTDSMYLLSRCVCVLRRSFKIEVLHMIGQSNHLPSQNYPKEGQEITWRNLITWRYNVFRWFTYLTAVHGEAAGQIISILSLYLRPTSGTYIQQVIRWVTPYARLARLSTTGTFCDHLCFTMMCDTCGC